MVLRLTKNNPHIKQIISNIGQSLEHIDISIIPYNDESFQLDNINNMLIYDNNIIIANSSSDLALLMEDINFAIDELNGLDDKERISLPYKELFVDSDGKIYAKEH